MLYTNSKLSTTKLAFTWLFDLQNQKHMQLEKVAVLHRNNHKEIEFANVSFDKFYRDFADGINQVILHGKYKNHPIKVILIIEDLRNRIFVETENSKIEECFVKQYLN